MLRRLKIFLILAVLLLLYDRWTRRQEGVRPEKASTGQGTLGEADSIVLVKDAPIVLSEEAPTGGLELPAEPFEAEPVAMEPPSPGRASVYPWPEEAPTGGLEFPAEPFEAEPVRMEPPSPGQASAYPWPEEAPISASEAAPDGAPSTGAPATGAPAGGSDWVPEAEAEPLARDDLTLIEGIGPWIASVLQQAGIHTFRQLAGTDIDWLKTLLREQKLRLADPSTWPEQARLAADGDWEGFQNLTDRLKGGRRVDLE